MPGVGTISRATDSACGPLILVLSSGDMSGEEEFEEPECLEWDAIAPVVSDLP